MSAETEYLRARYDEEEAEARSLDQYNGPEPWVIERQYDHHDMTRVLWASPAHVLADLAAKRKILDFDELWPVLVEKMPAVEVTDLASATMVMVQEMEWMTTLEYRKRFGDDPPTSAVISALLQPYADRDDFDQRWVS